MKSLSTSLGSKGFGYVIGVTLFVVVSGAGGIMSFESTDTTVLHYGGPS
jgi:hypothetical protein